ncbi:hypothetical protein [Spiroplasma endosymbiont of Polydrusus pterygomalis]|uniref:hypothetical protein n=1 Tax=Spiroplasma endosymbiont of Polydrusus pterygomalis TaxID=3139327 RepID=UPI003CCA979E
MKNKKCSVNIRKSIMGLTSSAIVLGSFGLLLSPTITTNKTNSLIENRLFSYDDGQTYGDLRKDEQLIDYVIQQLKSHKLEVVYDKDFTLNVLNKKDNEKIVKGKVTIQVLAKPESIIIDGATNFGVELWPRSELTDISSFKISLNDLKFRKKDNPTGKNVNDKQIKINNIIDEINNQFKIKITSDDLVITLFLNNGTDHPDIEIKPNDKIISAYYHYQIKPHKFSKKIRGQAKSNSFVVFLTTSIDDIDIPDVPDGLPRG